MRTYAVRAGYIPAAKVALFETMAAELAAMPDLEPAEDASCHAVCRAFERLHPEAVCVDGFFHAVGNEHSWLDLGGGIVADMTPIASSGPILVDASHWMVPWNRIYIERADLLDDGRGRRERAEAVAARLIEGMEGFET